jgi:hypothetical protein
MIAVNMQLYLLILDLLQIESSNALFDISKISEYKICSSVERFSCTVSKLASENLRWRLVRLRQVELSSSRRFSAEFEAFVSNGSMMYLRKFVLLTNGTTRINLIREPTSSSLFCIGVPVRHHLHWVSISITARNCFVSWWRIQWATITTSVQH